MKSEPGKVFSTDVLVIGGGIGGLCAANKAADQGVAVLIAEKSTAAWGGQAPSAGGLFLTVPPEGVEMQVKFVVEEGEYLNDQEWTETFVRDTYPCILEMAEWGDLFPKDISGKIINTPGMRITRIEMLLPTLLKRVLEKDAKVLNKVYIVDLLKRAGRIVGAIGFHYQTGEMKCVGCGICQMACSMKHYGLINKELARIQVRKYLLPLPKAVQVTCVQCPDGERECEKACPVSPPVIYFDKKSLHMVIDKDRCLGNECLQCRAACSAKAVISHPSLADAPFVCDLCDTENNGNRDPQCVNVCPTGALNFVKSTDFRFSRFSFQDITRIHADEKADLIARRLHPLKRNSMVYPGWR